MTARDKLETTDQSEYKHSQANGDRTIEGDIERLQGKIPPRLVTDADPEVDEHEEHMRALPPHVRKDLGLDDDDDESEQGNEKTPRGHKPRQSEAASTEDKAKSGSQGRSTIAKA